MKKIFGVIVAGLCVCSLAAALDDFPSKLTMSEKVHIVLQKTSTLWTINKKYHDFYPTASMHETFNKTIAPMYKTGVLDMYKGKKLSSAEITDELETVILRALSYSEIIGDVDWTATDIAVDIDTKGGISGIYLYDIGAKP